MQLAAAVNPRVRALIVLSGFGGLRTGELLALTRRDVDLVHKTIQVRASPRAALIYQHATTERDRLITDYLDAHIAAAEAAAEEVRRAPIKPLRSAPESS